MVVRYPFHPLCGQQLQVFVSARSSDGAVTVEDGNGKRLKIPIWMVVADAADIKLTDAPTVNAASLLQLVEFWELHFGKLPALEVDPEMEPDHEATLVDRAT